MFAELIRAAEIARKTEALDDITRKAVAANALGELTDDDAQAIAAAAHYRRKVLAKGYQLSQLKPARIRRRNAPKTYDKIASLERRRAQVASGAMPPSIASKFPPGETAVLSVIAWEVMKNGTCELCNDEIAARAGVASKTTVRDALYEARLQGAVHVKSRPVLGKPSLTNIITITSPKWRLWLEHRGGGSKSPWATVTVVKTTGKTFEKLAMPRDQTLFQRRSSAELADEGQKRTSAAVDWEALKHHFA